MQKISNGAYYINIKNLANFWCFFPYRISLFVSGGGEVLGIIPKSLAPREVSGVMTGGKVSTIVFTYNSLNWGSLRLQKTYRVK